MKKVKSLSCSARLGLRNGMKIYILEVCAVRLVFANTVAYTYILKQETAVSRECGVKVAKKLRACAQSFSMPILNCVI